MQGWAFDHRREGPIVNNNEKLVNNIKLGQSFITHLYYLNLFSTYQLFSVSHMYNYRARSACRV